MWDEERDIYEALDEHDLETEFNDEFSEVALDSEMEDVPPVEALDAEDLYDDED